MSKKGPENKTAGVKNAETAYNEETSTTVVLEAQWGICPAPCVLRQYTVVFA